MRTGDIACRELSSPIAGPPARSRRRGGTVALAVLAVMLVGLVAFLARPRLTAEERRLVGSWYGLHRTEHGRAYAWLSTERADGRSVTLFRYYIDAPGPERYTDQIERSRWSCRDGVMTFTILQDFGGWALLKKMEYLLAFGEWPAEYLDASSYELTELGANDIRYKDQASGTSYHSIRVRNDFVMPEEPTSVEAVRDRSREDD